MAVSFTAVCVFSANRHVGEVGFQSDCNPDEGLSVSPPAAIHKNADTG